MLRRGRKKNVRDDLVETDLPHYLPISIIKVVTISIFFFWASDACPHLITIRVLAEVLTARRTPAVEIIIAKLALNAVEIFENFGTLPALQHIKQTNKQAKNEGWAFFNKLYVSVFQ